jgi:uncharacterized membrane protein
MMPSMSLPSPAPLTPPPIDSAVPPAAVDAATPLPPVVAWSRAVAVGSLLGLIVLGLAWELVLAPTGNRTLALKVLPLAIPLTGLLKNRMYTYRWVSLVIWLYFIEGVIRAAGDRGLSAWLAGGEVALCVVLFTACAVHVRWRLHRAQVRAAAESGAPAA